MDDYIDRLITNIRWDVNEGWDFFKAVDFETGAGAVSEIRHIELGNGVDAITSRYAEGFSYKKDGPYTRWNLETVLTFAIEFPMKIVVLKKHDCDSEWNMTDDFDEYDCELDTDENGRVTQKEYAHLAHMIHQLGVVPEYSKGLNVMDYCKDIEDAYVFDTVDDVEKAYNEYTDNLKDEYAYDPDTLHEELDKAQKGKDEIIEQVKRKSSSEFVMIPCVDFDADGLKIMPKFSTMFYDSFNGRAYALGLIFKEQ